MKIIVKNSEQIQKMQVAGLLASQVLDMIGSFVVPGATTAELNDICHDYIVNTQHAIPAPLNYRGFPKSICTSTNHVVCHGIPTNKVLKNGDILNIDVTVIKDGFHGDTSRMFFVGGRDNSSILAKRLVDTAYECMMTAIQQIRPGGSLRDIAVAIESCAKPCNFSIVESFCGHGIGEGFHEDPQVLHYIPQDRHTQKYLDVRLHPGMIFTVEPMINAGKKHVTILSDSWTVVTKDRSLSAQWEHTVLVTHSGYQILTIS